MNQICEFSVSSDNKVEDVSMFDEDIYNENEMEQFIKGLIRDKRVIVGERCEGEVFHSDNNTLKVKYRYCIEIGEDWEEDIWETESVETTLP